MSNATEDRKAIAAVCTCGGWVMLAALGYSPDSDADSYREVGEAVREGFDVRHGTVGEFRKLPACEHRGRCTTAPSKVPDAPDPDQLEMSPE